MIKQKITQAIKQFFTTNASRSRINQETANELRRRKQQCEAYNRFVGQPHVRLTRTGRIKNDWDHTEMMAQVGKY